MNPADKSFIGVSVPMSRSTGLSFIMACFWVDALMSGSAFRDVLNSRTSSPKVNSVEDSLCRSNRNALLRPSRTCEAVFMVWVVYLSIVTENVLYEPVRGSFTDSKNRVFPFGLFLSTGWLHIISLRPFQGNSDKKTAFSALFYGFLRLFTVCSQFIHRMFTVIEVFSIPAKCRFC